MTSWSLRTATHSTTVFSNRLNIKRLEELVGGCFGLKWNFSEPLSLWPASLCVVTHELGVIVIDPVFVHCDQRATARLVTRVVIQTDFAESRKGHLVSKRLSSLLDSQELPTNLRADKHCRCCDDRHDRVTCVRAEHLRVNDHQRQKADPEEICVKVHLYTMR